MKNRNSFVYLIGARFVLILLSFFADFTHPHIIRQVDTLGVSLRYWMRWSQESLSWHSFLPAVLTSGDFYGISPMEFPLSIVRIKAIFES